MATFDKFPERELLSQLADILDEELSSSGQSRAVNAEFCALITALGSAAQGLGEKLVSLLNADFMESYMQRLPLVRALDATTFDPMKVAEELRKELAGPYGHGRLGAAREMIRLGLDVDEATEVVRVLAGDREDPASSAAQEYLWETRGISDLSAEEFLNLFMGEKPFGKFGVIETALAVGPEHFSDDEIYQIVMREAAPEVVALIRVHEFQSNSAKLRAVQAAYLRSISDLTQGLAELISDMGEGIIPEAVLSLTRWRFEAEPRLLLVALSHFIGEQMEDYIPSLLVLLRDGGDYTRFKTGEATVDLLRTWGLSSVGPLIDYISQEGSRRKGYRQALKALAQIREDCRQKEQAS